MKKLQILFSCFLFSVALHLMASNHIGGEWTMLTLKGKDINTMERPYLIINLEDSMLYGNNGCNAINGSVHLKGEGKITFDNIITTLAKCDNETSERNIMKALHETASFKIANENGIKYLTLMNAKGHDLMYLKNQDINFMNGAWTVHSINGENLTANNVRIVIDIQEMKIHGNSGCNIFNGTLFIDPYKDWGVEFQELVSTRKMCRDIRIETALLCTLEETQYCKELPDGNIVLLDVDEKEIAVLKRLKLK